MFKVTVLGKYGPYPAKNGATSGYLLSDKKNILVDCGSGVFNRLKKIMPPEKLDAVILTHLHFDHISDLGVLNYYFQLCGKTLDIYCPFENSVIYFSLYKNLKFYPTEKNMSLFRGDIQFEFYKMNHPVPTYGFTATSSDKTLSFTADTNVCSNAEILAQKADLYICDAGFLNKDYSQNKPHMSVEICCEISGRYNVKTILSHISPLYNEREIKAVIKQYINICIAQEEKEYTV